RRVQLCRGGQAAVAAEAGAAGTGDGGDDAGAVNHLADVIDGGGGLGDVNVVAGVDRHAHWVDELGSGRQAAVAAGAAAGDGRDDAGGVVDLADARVAGIGDEEIAAGVDRHTVGLELGGSSQAAVA